MVNFHDLIMFFNSDLSDWHCNEQICLKIDVYFLFRLHFFLRSICLLQSVSLDLTVIFSECCPLDWDCMDSLIIIQCDFSYDMQIFVFSWLIVINTVKMQAYINMRFSLTFKMQWLILSLQPIFSGALYQAMIDLISGFDWGQREERHVSAFCGKGS